MDRGAWQAIVHRVTKSQTQLKIPRTHTQSNGMYDMIICGEVKLILHMYV